MVITLAININAIGSGSRILALSLATTRRHGKVSVLGNCGLGFRLSPESGNRDYLVLDYGGNIERHDPVDAAAFSRRATGRKEPVRKPRSVRRVAKWSIRRSCSARAAVTNGRAAGTSASPPAHRASPSFREYTGTPLVKAIVRGLALAGGIREGGDFPTVKAIAEAHGLDPSNVRHAFNLAFLSPRILEAIAAGRDVPPDLSVARLLRVQSLVWDEQERELGFSG